MIVTTSCHLCQKTVHISCTREEYTAWKDGEPIKKAISNLTPAEREILISRTCGECHDKVFNEVEQ